MMAPSPTTHRVSSLRRLYYWEMDAQRSLSRREEQQRVRKAHLTRWALLNEAERLIAELFIAGLQHPGVLNPDAGAQIRAELRTMRLRARVSSVNDTFRIASDITDLHRLINLASWLLKHLASWPMGEIATVKFPTFRGWL